MTVVIEGYIALLVCAAFARYTMAAPVIVAPFLRLPSDFWILDLSDRIFFVWRWSMEKKQLQDEYKTHFKILERHLSLIDMLFTASWYIHFYLQIVSRLFHIFHILAYYNPILNLKTIFHFLLLKVSFKEGTNSMSFFPPEKLFGWYW